MRERMPVTEPAQALPAPASLAPERNPWLVLLRVALGLFMVVVDMSILNIALPQIAGSLNASMGSIQWTLIAYTLLMSALVPLFGRISDVIGRKRLFILGMAIFTVGSLFAGLATSILWLIGARLVQAVGGALITTNALAIITDTFPEGKRGAPMAAPRFPSGNVSVMMARTLVVIRAPPTAWTNRAPISQKIVGESAAIRLPSANIDTPVMKSRLRPMTSLMRPKRGTSAVMKSV